MAITFIVFPLLFPLLARRWEHEIRGHDVDDDPAPPPLVEVRPPGPRADRLPAAYPGSGVNRGI